VRPTPLWCASVRRIKYLVGPGFSRLVAITPALDAVRNPGVTPESTTSAESRLRFNKRALENLPLPQPGSRFTFHDLEVPGLQLRVTDRGIKSFCVFRRSKRGAPERITIGRFPTLSVERARVKAKRYLADLGEGVSVVAQQRNAALEGRTLDDVHVEYLTSRGITMVTVQRKDGKSVVQARLSPNAKLKTSTARDYVTVMAKKFADWRTKPLASITRDMVEARHLQLSERSPAEANRAMRYLRALFVFASDYRDSEGLEQLRSAMQAVEDFVLQKVKEKPFDLALTMSRRGSTVPD
jgi:hypothetical protein